ncbi:MAG: tetratricopeptide repeat protein [Bacteroidota bacterium]
MKYTLLFVLVLATSLLKAQPNCNIYKEDADCFEACMLLTKATDMLQGSQQQQVSFNKAIALCPQFHQAYYEKAWAFLKNGRFIEWRSIIDQAVELRPQEYLGYRAVARYQYLRDYQGALDDFALLDELVNYDLGNTVEGNYHLNIIRALCYKGLGAVDEAIEVILQQLQQSDHVLGNYDYIHLGVLYLEANQTALAVDYLEKQVAHNPYIADSFFYLAKAYVQNGEKGKAKTNLKKAKELYQAGEKRSHFYNEPMDAVYWRDMEELASML